MASPDDAASAADAAPAAERRVEVVDDESGRALLIDGTVQSVPVAVGATAGGYWPAMLPDRPPRDALLLGLGGGTVAHLLVGAFGPLPIVGVDDDAAVLALARAHFALDLPTLDVVLADAFAYAATTTRQFDLVCVDLFRAGRIPARVCSAPFLRDVRRLLRPGGLASFNLSRDRTAGDRLRQLEQHFAIHRRILVGFNLVVHCRPERDAPARGRAASRGRRPRRAGSRARPGRGAGQA
jgi:spermidine synthase